MTNDEFIHEYHHYQTRNPDEARALAGTIELEDGEHPVVVGFEFPGGITYCLMVPTAAEAAEQLMGSAHVYRARQ